MREITVKLFKYDELQPDAQERARNAWRGLIANGEGVDLDHVAEDFATCAALFGFDVRQKCGRNGRGERTFSPSLHYSVGGGQGDGAGFDAEWRAADVQPGKLREHAPQDVELNAIASYFEAVAQLYPSASMIVEQRGRGFRMSVDTELSDDEGEPVGEITYATIQERVNDLAHWLYRHLLSEYEWQLADEQIADSIRANELEFTEDGEQH